MTKRLSPNQAALVDALRASESRCVVPLGGGFWAVDGKRTAISSVTVYSLARAGLLCRTNTDPQYYRDTYQLAEAQSDG